MPKKSKTISKPLAHKNAGKHPAIEILRWTLLLEFFVQPRWNLQLRTRTFAPGVRWYCNGVAGVVSREVGPSLILWTFAFGFHIKKHATMQSRFCTKKVRNSNISDRWNRMFIFSGRHVATFPAAFASGALFQERNLGFIREKPTPGYTDTPSIMPDWKWPAWLSNVACDLHPFETTRFKITWCHDMPWAGDRNHETTQKDSSLASFGFAMNSVAI